MAPPPPLSAPTTPTTYRRNVLPIITTTTTTTPPLTAPTQRRSQSKAMASIAEGRQPPTPKKYQSFQSMAIERRALASTLAIGDTPRRRQPFSVDDPFLASRMSNSDYERFCVWVDNISDSPDQLVEKLEKNAKDNKDRLRKLSDSISVLTAGMKDFRCAKEDWDGMVDMSTKMVKRKRSETKDAYDRISDLNCQIGRELTKNYPYIPYEMLVDNHYAVSFPQTKVNQKKQ